MELRRRFQGQLKRPPAFVGGLRAICVRAHHRQLTLPDRRPIHLLLAGHTDGDYLAAASREAHRIVEARGAAHTVEGHVSAAQQQWAVHSVQAPRRGPEAHALEHVSGRDDLVGAELSRQIALRRVLGHGDQPLGRREELDRSDSQQADRARPLHHDVVVLGRATAQRRMNTAGKRLDQHGCVVAQRITDRMQLARVRDQHLSPSSTGVRAISGLEADFDRALRNVVAKAGPALGAARAWRLDAPYLAAERRFDDDTAAVVKGAHHFVPGNEGIAGEWVEVERGVPSDRGEVGAADAAQSRQHAHPIARGKLRLRDVAQLEHGERAGGDVGPPA